MITRIHHRFSAGRAAAGYDSPEGMDRTLNELKAMPSPDGTEAAFREAGSVSESLEPQTLQNLVSLGRMGRALGHCVWAGARQVSRVDFSDLHLPESFRTIGPAVAGVSAAVGLVTALAAGGAAVALPLAGVAAGTLMYLGANRSPEQRSETP